MNQTEKVLFLLLSSIVACLFVGQTQQRTRIKALETLSTESRTIIFSNDSVSMSIFGPTNQWIKATWGAPTNLVEHIHHWQPGCGVDGCLVIHHGPMRHCGVCGRVQEQQPGEWK